jgi:DNA polymerase-3 subunit epsilon
MNPFGLIRQRSRAGVPTRWIVLDCETSGLDAGCDALLSIGAIAVDGIRSGTALTVCPSDSFEVTLKPDQVSEHANILIHGIGQAAQDEGEDPLNALTEFVHWIGTAPLIAFHAPFDRMFIQKACQKVEIVPPANRWLDLAQLAPALFPRLAARSLDDWLNHFKLEDPGRHTAAADAFSTAQLLARLCAEAQAQGLHDFPALQKIASARRWLG